MLSTDVEENGAQTEWINNHEMDQIWLISCLFAMRQCGWMLKRTAHRYSG